MSVRHHLTDELISSYATGNMPESFSLVVATHISMCDDCRVRLETYEALGGAVMESVEPTPMDEGALARTLMLISASDRERPRKTPSGATLPEPLRDYVSGGLDSVNWKPVGGGVRQAVLATRGPGTVRLLNIPAGRTVPDHGHRGTELTLVLQGAFSDEFDRFARGDIEIADEADVHQPVAEQGADCICLSVTDAPLRFKGILPRLAQRFVGI